MANDASDVPRLKKRLYEPELKRLQAELVKVQEWVRAEGQRLVVIFEGRDAAGKGSTIKRLTQHLNPRIARIVALPKPTPTRGDRVVLPALCGAPSCRWGDGALRSLLVQPRRRREGHGLLHARRVPAVPASSARRSSACSSPTASCCASTGSR